MKNVEKLNAQELREVNGGLDLLEPWHGLPPNYFRYRIKRGFPIPELARPSIYR